MLKIPQKLKNLQPKEVDHQKLKRRKCHKKNPRLNKKLKFQRKEEDQLLQSRKINKKAHKLNLQKNQINKNQVIKK